MLPTGQRFIVVFSPRTPFYAESLGFTSIEKYVEDVGDFTVACILMEFKDVKLRSSHCCCVNRGITSHLSNNGNSHKVSNRQRGSMVDSNVQLLIIRSKYYGKVVVERCACYLG